MAEFIEDSAGLESTTIGIFRTSATVKGGRRFSFSALVAVGDRNGSVGLGYGKAPGVPAAIEKAQKNARKKMHKVTLQEGTLPHAIEGKFKSAKVKLVPASPGTGVIAGATVRAVLEMAGIHDCLTKSMGSTNQQNLAKATLHGLNSLMSKAKIAELRGVDFGTSRVDEKLELGRRFAPAKAPRENAPARPAPRGKGKGRDQQPQRGGRGKPRRDDRRGPAPAPEARNAPAPGPGPAAGESTPPTTE